MDFNFKGPEIRFDIMVTKYIWFHFHLYLSPLSFFYFLALGRETQSADGEIEALKSGKRAQTPIRDKSNFVFPSKPEKVAKDEAFERCVFFFLSWF